MRYATVKISADSVVSLTQNEVASTLYVLKGNAEISNLDKQSLTLGKGQKITISQTDASNKDLDMNSLKGSLDSFFTSSEWFIKNNGDTYLKDDTEGTSGSGTSESGATSTGTVSSLNSSPLVVHFTNVSDNDNVTSDTTTLEGDFTSNQVYLITADDKQADINTDEKTFSITGVDTSKKENDIVIKVYNESREIMQKSVLTLYNEGVAETTNTPFQVENYSLDATEFQFISPKTNPYTTTENVVMIEGRVPVGVVKKILVNGYQLQKFPQYGSYWSYFANSQFGNLKEGLNIYKVEYYDKNDSVITSNAFTIIKNTDTPKQESGSGSTGA